MQYRITDYDQIMIKYFNFTNALLFSTSTNVQQKIIKT